MRLFFAAVALVLAMMPADALVAQSAEELVSRQHVMIRTRLEPIEPVLVGQPVKLWVEVLTKTWFREAPQYPSALEVQNAIVLPPEAFGVNATERIGGQTYASQSRNFTIFPQTVGRFEVPAVPVKLVVALDDGSPSPPITLITEPTVIEASVPEQAKGLGVVLSTPRLSVEESYDRNLDGLKVGESFRRTVTMKIDNSVGMLLPPTPFEAPAGIALYEDRPQVSDQRGRGQMAGSRIDTASFVLEKEGAYELPEIVIPWWDLTSDQLRREVLPRVELEVSPNPDLGAEHFGQADEEELEETVAEPVAKERRVGWRQVLLGSLLIVIVVVALRRLRSLPDWLEVRRRKTADSEATYYQRLGKIASSGDAAKTYRALMAWLDRALSDDSPVTLRMFVSRYGDDALAAQVAGLESELYSTAHGSSHWDPRDLLHHLGQARQKLLQTGDKARLSGSSTLPALNPPRSESFVRSS